MEPPSIIWNKRPLKKDPHGEFLKRFNPVYKTKSEFAESIDQNLFFNTEGEYLTFAEIPAPILFEIETSDSDDNDGQKTVGTWGVLEGGNTIQGIKFKVNKDLVIIDAKPAECLTDWRIGKRGQTEILESAFLKDISKDLKKLSDPSSLVSSWFTIHYPQSI